MPTHTLSKHAYRKCADLRLSPAAVLAAADNPGTRYESRNHPGQYRHIAGDIVAIVNPRTSVVITVYANVRETALRPDQVARGVRTASGRTR